MSMSGAGGCIARLIRSLTARPAGRVGHACRGSRTVTRFLRTSAAGIAALSLSLSIAATAGADWAPVTIVTIPMAGQGGTDADTDADTVRYPTLCTGEDWVVFNAVSRKNGKIVSICVSEGDDTMPSHLTYRFGHPGQAELVFPAARQGSEAQFVIRRYTRPQVTYLKFEFTANGHNFEILDGGEGADIYTELRVIRLSDGKIVAAHPLQPQTEHLSLMQLEGWVPSAPFDE